ncbi:unnamed protein product [Auanema sp. JU1783]|nr:unnamed protein product [Auanema sp. JU1783]
MRGIGLLFLTLFIRLTVFANDEDKDVFVPLKFVAPKTASAVNLLESFGSKDAIGRRWIKSVAKKDGVDKEIAKYNGEWAVDEPSLVSIEGDYGLIVKTKARHHAISGRLVKPFIFGERPLVIQYQVQFEEGQECGGGYVKLLSEGAEKDLGAFTDTTPYTIMFGPDKCGATGKIHLIFRYKNPKNNTIHEHHVKQPSNLGTTYWDDHKPHLYTAVINPNGDFSVNIDEKNVIYGNMLKDLTPSLVPPVIIDDPTDKKPQEWDDRAEIDDVEATKPDDWDESQPMQIVDETAVKPDDWLEEEPDLIPDSEARKPDDWDADMDGEWEPPSVDNPACKGVSGCGPWKRPSVPNPKYKGKWVCPKKANPAYKGVWKPRQIPNPNHFEPTAFGGLSTITAVGIELWTMSQNIIFDNILICDSEDTAHDVAKQTYYLRKSEDARLAASMGEGGGFFQYFIDAAEEKPWLWAVYVFGVLIPTVFVGVFCFGRKSTPHDSYSYNKKHDVFMEDDDKIPNLVDEEGNEVRADEEEEEKADESDDVEEVVEEEKVEAKTAAKSSPKAEHVPKAMELIEADDSESDGEKRVEKVSPAVSKRKARRQD